MSGWSFEVNAVWSFDESIGAVATVDARDYGDVFVAKVEEAMGCKGAKVYFEGHELTAEGGQLVQPCKLHGITHGDTVVVAPPEDGLVKTNELKLIRACATGDLDSVSRLLKSGVGPSTTANRGNQPVHYAARAGRTAILSLLLEADGSVASAVHQSGAEPLALATKGFHVNCMELLLLNGADPNAGIASKSKYPQSPLHICFSNFKTLLTPEPIALLLEHGASMELRDIRGARPLDLLKNRTPAYAWADLMQYTGGVYTPEKHAWFYAAVRRPRYLPPPCTPSPEPEFFDYDTSGFDPHPYFKEDTWATKRSAKKTQGTLVIGAPRKSQQKNFRRCRSWFIGPLASEQVHFTSGADVTPGKSYSAALASARSGS